ncbi:site-specific integrase [soil metagenome]
MSKLTPFAVTAAKKKPGRYQDGKGLQLFVKDSGAAFWVLRIQANGKRRDVGLGSAETVKLKEARDAAEAIRALYKKGSDPVADRRAAKLATALIPTFSEATTIAHGEHKGGWRNLKHREDWLSSLKRYAHPTLGDLRIDLIDASTVRDVLLPIWLDRPETARRVRQRIKLVLDWAAAKGYRPALDLSGIAKALPRQPKSDSHFKAMPYPDVPAFVASLKDSGETVSRLALQFLILTAARSGEVRGATLAEIDVDAATWTIPAERMKAGKEHVVPLSKPALAILERMLTIRKTDVAVIFPGTKNQPLSDMTMLKIMRDRSLPFSVHGFRSAFKTWAVEATSFPDAVSEAALAHIDANKVRAAYSRTDFRQQREQLMAAWANFIGEGGATVHAIHPATTLAA